MRALPTIIILSASLLVFATTAVPSPSGGARRSLSPLGKADSCVSCHAFKAGTTHPIQVRSSRAAGLPLGPGDTVECLTCHQVPSSFPNHKLTGEGAGLLKPAKQLCQSCHSATPNGTGPLFHGLVSGRAHFTPDKSADISAVGLDPESRACLSCHDESAAGGASVRLGGSKSSAPVRFSSWKAEHPIGVRYGGKNRPGQTPQYQPKASLPPTMQLYEGKVGCGSCHSLYAGYENMLSVEPRQGNLCLSCHIK